MKKKFLVLAIFGLMFIPQFHVRAASPVKILIVPGHDNDVWGAQYGTTKEADMNLAVATNIYNILKKDKRFKVYITRDANGYTKEFADYFIQEKDDITAFRTKAKEATAKNIEKGTFVKKENLVKHINASDKVAQILYGINKWADDKKMDAVIHVHFNDYPRTNSWEMGIYKGFAIYMPENEMKNSKKSQALAKKVFTEMTKTYAISTYPPEKGGLIPDQSLIALGSNGTLLSSVRSILIEYGYIYRFGNENVRKEAYKKMASLTAAGIKNYFFTK